MRYFPSAILLLFIVPACAPDKELATEDLAAEVADRWDVTATRNGSSFPLWLELKQTEGVLGGRIQGRTGHALEMDLVVLSDSSVVMTAGEMTLTGALSGGRFSGTGRYREASSFSWTSVRAPELPKPEVSDWGEPVELFNGVDLTGWRSRNPDDANLWAAQDGVLVNRGKGTDLITEESFRNFKLHFEVSCPQGSNSGVYLRGRYEVQVEDSYGLEPHSRRLGGVYGQITPTSNPAKPAGEWHVFDITLLGRWITIDLNGERIVDDREIPGITGGALDSAEAEPGPIMIQGDHGEVSYRNLVLTPAID